MKTYGTDGASDGLRGLRTPPQNIEVEQALISAAVRECSVLDDVARLVAADDLYRAAHQTLWRAILETRERHGQVDAYMLVETLTARGELDAVGGIDYLTECLDSVPHAANAVYHAQIVRQKAIARRLIEASESIARDAYAGQHTAEELCGRAEEFVFAATESAAKPRDHAALAEVTGEALAALEAREEGETLGIGTGFPELDSVTDGFHPGQVVIVAARPSQGKTALALNFADYAATALKQPTLFVSLEMGRAELGERYLSMRGKVDGHRMKNPEYLSDADRVSLARALDASRESRLVIDDTPAATVAQIAAGARRVKSRRGLDLLFVDYLQLIEGPRQKGESREQEVARVSRRLKALARELRVPVVVLAQLNREAERREGNRPRLSDLRESGQIEQDADVVMLLHRPEYYDPNDQPGVAELIVAKNRNGRTGTVKLTFLKHLTRFESHRPIEGAEAF